MKFTFAGKEYDCKESQKGEYVEIYRIINRYQDITRLFD